MNFKVFIKKSITKIEFPSIIHDKLLTLYLKSIFYRLKHVKKSKYSWLKEIKIELLDSQFGMLTYKDLRFILEKKSFEEIPSHQKYLYAALITYFKIPSFYILFWDDLVIFDEIFIEDLYKLKEFPIKFGDTVLDIGASIGWYSCRVAKLTGDKGKIIAVEPNLRNFALLTKNVTLNKLDNVILINKGIWDVKIKQKLMLKGYASSVSEKIPIKNYEEVQFDTIDNMLREYNINEVNEIKMDIEGAEIKAIQGSQETLKNSKNLILKIAAYHKTKSGFQTYEKLIPLLKEWQFDIHDEYLPMIFGKKMLN